MIPHKASLFWFAALLANGQASAQLPMTVSMVLRLRDPAGAEALLRRVSDPADAQYGRFLTPVAFDSRFGPLPDDVARVRAVLAGYGLKSGRVGSALLEVRGVPASMEQAFGVTLHDFQFAGQGGKPGYHFRAPLQAPTMPAAIAGLVYGVEGLDDRPVAHSQLRRAGGAIGHPSAVRLTASRHGIPDDAPGLWTAGDFARYYDATPLYRRGITGGGFTLGIVALAGFGQSDAYRYWAGSGVAAPPGRIAEVAVDGGAGVPDDAAGSDETTLDVEQAGGVAPGAKLLVYEAPNGGRGFLDAFAVAVQDDLSDAIVCGWGAWEAFYTLGAGSIASPIGGITSAASAGFHQIFLQAGLQGQSVFVAAGSAGAYGASRDFPPPASPLTLTVDAPASDPAVTAVGGTTLASAQALFNGAFTLDVPAERVWGWDYLGPACALLGDAPVACGILPVGGGGGISVVWARPAYQDRLAGLQKTQAGQALPQVGTAVGGMLPAGFAGRNVPDLSVDADPDTGYALGYTGSAAGSVYGVQPFIGGSGAAAAQIGGAALLLAQSAGHRLGFLNPLLYGLARAGAQPGAGNGGQAAAVHVIDSGDNEFFAARHGYSPAAGLGTPDIANLAAAIPAWK